MSDQRRMIVSRGGITMSDDPPFRMEEDSDPMYEDYVPFRFKLKTTVHGVIPRAGIIDKKFVVEARDENYPTLFARVEFSPESLRFIADCIEGKYPPVKTHQDVAPPPKNKA